MNNGDMSYLLSLGSLKAVQKFTYETTYLLLDVINSMSYISPYVSPDFLWNKNFSIYLVPEKTSIEKHSTVKIEIYYSLKKKKIWHAPNNFPAP